MKNLYVLIFIVATASIITTLYRYLHQPKASGVVIILNGPSASGKSSIQKEFQTLMMPNLWIKLGIDNLFDIPMPDITIENLEYWQKPNLIRWITNSKDQENNPIMTLFTGEQGDNVAYGMNSAIAAYAQNGCNMIVDYIGYKKEWIDDLQNKLKNIKTYWVKVAIPLETLEEREKARSTSPKGHARSHYDFVYWNLPYNLEVNSGRQSASEIAQMIKEKLQL